MTQDELSKYVAEVIKIVQERTPDTIDQALILEVASKQIAATTQATAVRQALWNALKPGGGR